MSETYANACSIPSERNQNVQSTNIPSTELLNLMGRWFRTLFIFFHFCHTSSFLILFDSVFCLFYFSSLLVKIKVEGWEDFDFICVIARSRDEEGVFISPRVVVLRRHTIFTSFLSLCSRNSKCKQKKTVRNDKKYCTIKQVKQSDCNCFRCSPRCMIVCRCQREMLRSSRLIVCIHNWI